MSSKPSLLHEIKSPLTAAKLGINLLKMELHDKFSQEPASPKIDEIHQIIESIEAKINQCVDVLQQNRSAFESASLTNQR